MIKLKPEELLEIVKDFVEDLSQTHNIKFPLMLIGINNVIHIYEKVNTQYLKEACELLKNKCEWYSVIVADDDKIQIVLKSFDVTGEKELIAIRNMTNEKSDIVMIRKKGDNNE